MKATKKSSAVESAMTAMFGFDRTACIRDERCVPAPIGCGNPIEGFRDTMSEREFTISGLCQKCQDAFFGE